MASKLQSQDRGLLSEIRPLSLSMSKVYTHLAYSAKLERVLSSGFTVVEIQHTAKTFSVSDGVIR